MDKENLDEKSSTSIAAKYRSPCFSIEEVIVLITIIDKYKHVILNKSTTLPACNARELCWSKIAKIFNQKGFKHLRSADSLKNKWENLKKGVRRISRNVIDLRHSEYKEVYDQVITLLSEGENINNGTMEFSIHSDNDENEPEEQKESTRDSRYWEEFDRDSPNSTDTENGRRARYRSPCFSIEEVIALMTIIDKYKHVILNKSTTKPACHARELCWSQIAKIFNQKGFKHLRSADNLKIKWENLKKQSVSRNVIDLGHSKYKEVYDQVITLLCEGENINNGTIEFSIHSDNDENEAEEQKKSTRDSRFWEELDSDSQNSKGAENGRRAHFASALKFSPQECGLLLKLVKQEKKVLFRKSTTTKAIKLRNIAWKRITDSYNKLSPESRTTKVLRTKFLNMKRLAQKVNTDDHKKPFSNEHEELEYEPSEKIKSEPSYELAMEEDSTPNDDDDPVGVEESQEVTSNLFGHAADTEDPLNTVLNCDSGLENDISHIGSAVAETEAASISKFDCSQYDKSMLRERRSPAPARSPSPRAHKADVAPQGTITTVNTSRRRPTMRERNSTQSLNSQRLNALMTTCMHAEEEHAVNMNILKLQEDKEKHMLEQEKIKTEKEKLNLEQEKFKREQEMFKMEQEKFKLKQEKFKMEQEELKKNQDKVKLDMLLQEFRNKY